MLMWGVEKNDSAENESLPRTGAGAHLLPPWIMVIDVMPNRVFAVAIDNGPKAGAPQTNLDEADLVFEVRWKVELTAFWRCIITISPMLSVRAQRASLFH